MHTHFNPLSVCVSSSLIPQSVYFHSLLCLNVYMWNIFTLLYLLKLFGCAFLLLLFHWSFCAVCLETVMPIKQVYMNLPSSPLVWFKSDINISTWIVDSLRTFRIWRGKKVFPQALNDSLFNLLELLIVNKDTSLH